LRRIAPSPRAFIGELAISSFFANALRMTAGSWSEHLTAGAGIIDEDMKSEKSYQEREPGKAGSN
jgi:hypothetical protein